MSNREKSKLNVNKFKDFCLKKTKKITKTYIRELNTFILLNTREISARNYNQI